MCLDKNYKAEEWVKILSSAFFILWISCFSLTTNLYAQDEQTPTRPIIGIPSFTPQHSIQCAEGELFIFTGESRIPIQPVSWQALTPKQLAFSIDEVDTRLYFNISSTTLNSASQAISGTIIQCTAETKSNQNTNISVWLAWRHNSTEKKPTFGSTLHHSIQSSIEIKNHPDPWSPKLSWFFHNNAFLRNNSVLYWINKFEGWDITQSVRDSSPPYNDLQSTNWLGWTKFSSEINLNQSIFFSAFAPYSPIHKSEYISFTSQ